MLLSAGASALAGFIASAPPYERSQDAGDAVAAAAGGLPAVLGKAKDGRRGEQPEARERPAEVGARGVAGGSGRIGGAA
jgi:hypothetical protein